MAIAKLFTAHDALCGLRDFLGNAATSTAQQDLLRAIHIAYHELRAEHTWPSLKKHGRVLLKAAETGTLSYDHTGGAYERLVTLDSGYTLPSWSEDALIRIGDSLHSVEDYKSTTTCTLDVVLNPGADIATGTSFTIFPAWYHLPADFGSLLDVHRENLWSTLQWVDFDTMLQLQRFEDSTGYPRYFTVAAVPDLMDTHGLFIHPSSDTQETLDFSYYRKPRPILYSGETPIGVCSPGTISVTSGSATATGSGTSFESGMVGSAIRIGRDVPNSNRSNLPTAHDGRYPFAEEFIIHAVASTTSITLDRAASASRSGVGYVVSDPIDVPEGLKPVFMAAAVNSIASIRNMENRGAIYAAYQRALDLARSQDNRTRGRITCGKRRGVRWDAFDGPYSDDVE